MNIGFDLDNTLIDTGDCLIKMASVALGYKLQDDWQEYDYNFTKFPEYVRKFLIETAYHDDEFLFGIIPDQNIINRIKKLKQNGHNIYIVTARSQLHVIEMTKLYINKYFPFINKVLFSPYKFEYIKEYDMEIFVDDLYEHAEDIIEHTNADVCVIRKPYNSEFEDNDRIKFYDNINQVFDELEKKNG